MPDVQKLRELKNAEITHVSYVDKGANQRKFFMTKSDDQEDNPTFQKQVDVLINKDDAEQLVYGVVYEPETPDSHDDYMTADEIQKSAHGFITKYRNMDTQHDFQTGVGEVVESYIAPQDFEVGGETIAKGSWVLVTKASDEIWEQIQKGEITGYSMAGTAEAIEKEEEKVQFDHDLPNFSQFMKAMKNMFTKGELADAYNAGRKRRNMFDALWLFEDFIIDEIFSDNPNTERIQELSMELSDILQEVAQSQDVLKSFQTEYNESEEIHMKKEDMQELMKEALGPINDRLDSIEKQVNDEQEENAEGVEKDAEGKDTEGTENKSEGVEKSSEEDTEKEDSNEELLKSFKEVVTEAVAPIEKRLDTVEKARGLSNNAQDDAQDDVQKQEGSVFTSLFTQNR